MIEVLIVDDEQHIRELLALWLSAEGFAVSEAEDAESALAVIAERPIAVATIDRDMPGHDGEWLIEQIQQRNAGVAMLLATGNTDISERVALSRGVLGYLIKPFRRDLIVSAVHDAVAWHRVAAKKTAR